VHFYGKKEKLSWALGKGKGNGLELCYKGYPSLWFEGRVRLRVDVARRFTGTIGN